MSASSGFVVLAPDADAGELRETWARLWLQTTGILRPGVADDARTCAECCRCGQCWQYMGTEFTGRDGMSPAWWHSFRHRCGRGCQLRRYEHVRASPGWLPALEAVR